MCKCENEFGFTFIFHFVKCLKDILKNYVASKISSKCNHTVEQSSPECNHTDELCSSVGVQKWNVFLKSFLRLFYLLLLCQRPFVTRLNGITQK